MEELKWNNNSYYYYNFTVNILLCWFQNLNRNYLHLPLCFQRYPRTTHDVYTHHMNSTCTFSIPSHKNIPQQYWGQRDIFRFACVIRPFAQQWSVLADLAQACILGYLVIINVLFMSLDELEGLKVNRLWKQLWNVLHCYCCLPHSTFPIHLSVATTNTAFLHVFSPRGSLMWSGHFSQGWHSPIKQTKFRLQFF